MAVKKFKSNNNPFVRNIKWAVLTILAGMMMNGKAHAQIQTDKEFNEILSSAGNYDSPLLPEKKRLSRQDSLIVYQRCLPQNFVSGDFMGIDNDSMNIDYLIEEKHSTLIWLNIYKYEIEKIIKDANGNYTSKDIENIKWRENRIAELNTEITGLDYKISKVLAECFNTYVTDSKGLRIFPFKGYMDECIVIVGNVINIDGNNFFVTPGNKLATERMWIACKNIQY